MRKICPMVGIQWEITGREHLAKQISAVVVCNHQSAWDFMGNRNLNIRCCDVGILIILLIDLSISMQ